MNESKTVENDGKGEPVVRRTPPIVSPETWETAREQMLVKEKTLTARETPWPTERRRMPWMVVEKAYEFEGPKGRVSLLDLLAPGGTPRGLPSQTGWTVPLPGQPPWRSPACLS